MENSSRMGYIILEREFQGFSAMILSAFFPVSTCLISEDGAFADEQNGQKGS